jgi:hypothetical protein
MQRNTKSKAQPSAILLGINVNDEESDNMMMLTKMMILILLLILLLIQLSYFDLENRDYGRKDPSR